MKTTITFEIDTDRRPLRDMTDARLAQLWHIAQANPAPHIDRDAGSFAEDVGREIIRRWLAAAPVELYAHQGRSYYWDILVRHGGWPAPDRVWVYDPAKSAPAGDSARG